MKEEYIRLSKNKKSMRFNLKVKNNLTPKFLYSSLLILATIFIGHSDMFAQCSGKALACNNLVQVSLDTTCKAKITPDVVLQGIGNDTSLYRVEVRDPFGNLIPNNILTQDYNGAKLEVRVYCKVSGLYCWGYIKVEDKIKPSIKISPRDTAVSCFRYSFQFNPNELLNKPPKFSDNGCIPPTLLAPLDIVRTNLPCRDTVQVITRLWTVKDGAGNTCTDTQYIHILRTKIGQLTFPKDTVVDCLDEADLSVAKLGSPEVRSCTHFEIVFKDVIIPVCGVSRKILRIWTVYDICSDSTRMHTQVIKITDNKAPVISFSNFTIPMDRVVSSKNSCTASIIDIPNPVITDCNLAQTTVEVFYQLLDNLGNLTGPLLMAGANKILSQPNSSTTGQIIWNLSNIPIGVKFKVIFVANDGCGNISRDTTQALILPDKTSPNAVCEGSTTVTLNAGGSAEIFASTFDDHSYDNCGIVKKEVRRFTNTCSGFSNETQFRNSIHFCCDDIERNPIKVVFRVYDAANNFSDCVVDVYVQDKRTIGIVCPGNRIFNCSFDPAGLKAELEKTKPQVTWVCGEKSLILTVPTFTLSSCKTGTVTVTWTAMDRNGQMATCIQKIDFVNQSPPTVNRPSLTINLNGCTNGTAPEQIPNSQPTVSNVDCEQIAITHTDQLFVGDPGSCIKILRKWAILDWCKFTGGSTASAVIDSFTQTIRITDTVKPKFASPCTDITVVDDNQDCEHFVSLIAAATDECTSESELVYSYTIDLDSNNGIDIQKPGKDASGIYKVGKHRISFRVTDKCGNFEVCSYNFTVKSTKTPIPVCKGAIEANIGLDGTVTIRAIDLDIKSTNGCGESSAGLTFAFDANGVQTTRTFNCSDLPNGVEGLKSVQLWVIDTDGLRNSCTVQVFLNDRNNNRCPDNIGNSAVTGFINDESKTGAEKIPVVAKNMATGSIVNASTDKTGKYSFQLSQYEDYSISPALTGHDLTGISTLDIVMIQQHILGLNSLNSPYKLLSADVNSNNSISASDLVELRRLILGQSTKLSGPSWKFVKKDYVFDDPSNPWGYASNGLVSKLVNDMTNVDFVGIKVGDVSGNAFGVLAQTLAGPRSNLKIKVESQQLNDKVRYAFYADNQEIIGFQMALNFDNAMITNVYSEQIALREEHILVKNNAVKMSWNDRSPVHLDERPLFVVEIKTDRHLKASKPLLDNSVSAEVYSSNLETKGVQLEMINNRFESTGEFKLMQNQPNPFSDRTVISFDTPNSGTVELLIHDVSGKVIHKHNDYYTKGINHIEITNKDLQGPGLYYYTVTAGEYLETRRMIVLH